MAEPTIPDLLALSRLALRFGQVHRVTLDAQGRRESDTTHTVMLALLAGALCEHEAVPLDCEAVVALALVHDLAEAYAGDVSTVRALSLAEANAKAAREEDALARIRAELAAFPWIVAMIDRYEAQACPESRWVRYLDKITPKLTHRDNGCAVPKAAGMTLAELRKRHAYQGAELAAMYPAFTFARELFEAASADAESQWPTTPTKRTCNLHDDCDAADARMRHTARGAASHCHDDSCEECFGS